MAEWKTYKLGEILDIVMGQSPQGEDCNNEGVGIPLLNGPSEFSFYHPCPIQWTTNSKKTSQKYDILFCVRGSTTGRMNWSDQEYSIGRGLAAIRHKKGIEYRYFAKALMDFYLLKILSSATGSTFPNVSKDILNNLLVSVPNLAVQKQIADILSSLDDKIEVNRKINENLEQQAEALFKSWFVDFEPFKDGKFIDSELGKIPEGWRVGTLGEIATLNAGGDKPVIYSPVMTKDCSIPIYSNGITNKGLYGYTNEARIFNECITVSARGTIGYVCLRMTPYVPIVRLISVIPADNMSAKYLYLWMLNQNISGTGTTQQQLTVPYFSKSKILIPPFDIIKKFTIIVDSFFINIEKNISENDNLSQLRDVLLPKLMSDEIKL